MNDTLMNYTWVDSPIGRLLLGGDQTGLRFIDFPSAKPRPLELWQKNEDSLREAAVQLDEYFRSRRREFELRLQPEGTLFQQRVWKELLAIPYGSTISYGQLANRVGNPKASRAVGLANGSNPLPIVIPCHRVIGSKGRLTGYGGGLPIKEHLLRLEARQLTMEDVAT